LTIVPRWEWRTFGESFGKAEERLSSSTPERIDDSDETYLLSTRSDASVKIRGGVMDVKHLEAVNDDGLEQWRPVMKGEFPLTAGEVAAVVAELGLEGAALERDAYTLAELAHEVVEPHPELGSIDVHKHREHHTIGGCMTELSALIVEGVSIRTVVVEGEDPVLVAAAVRELGLAGRRNTCMARGLKALLGFGARRFAVIDVGTNSVKFHLGELEADGTWRTVADRAEVTRLGEGLDETGRLGPAPMARTVEAIAAMAGEAERDGVEAIAAVGTAWMRIASNSADLVEAVRKGSGVEIEVIPGEEEARLAYLAATSGLGVSSGSLVVFDTGGGSSQFTFGAPGRIDEQFSVNVGAARFTEQFGLDRAVSAEVVAEARRAIGADLSRLDGRPVPDLLVGLGGGITNMAAVKHGLPRYDAEVVQGTELDTTEIDRQIELYRARSADERREIVGLQPKRAEVMLAGACIVRTVLEKLGRDSLLVSDRGLRHGLLVERFSSP
jgi:exopolyphosphatase / guanosine-5'-triphosphate,3'-diphosphate pyrophosphatase